MTQLVAKYAMKKVLGKEMEKYKSKDVAGPYVSLHSPFSHVTVTDSAGPLLRRDPASHQEGQDEEGQKGDCRLHPHARSQRPGQSPQVRIQARLRAIHTIWHALRLGLRHWPSARHW
jgi:hypothetical protein